MNNLINLAMGESARDHVFADTDTPIGDFRFDAAVAAVFDDMVSRSVPQYAEIQQMVCDLARDFARPGTALYDVGCSTATTLLALDPLVAPDVRFVGIDNSQEMLDRARCKVDMAAGTRPFDLLLADVNDDVNITSASVVTMLLTLQFVRPLRRERLMRKLHHGMVEGGCMILVEKLTCEETTFNRLFMQHYYDFKRRNGYSETEIARKREALENVLIPYSLEENVQLLREAGFSCVETFFRWYNFCGLIAVKRSGR